MSFVFSVSSISIDRRGKVPVYRQIAVAVTNAISGGVLKAGPSANGKIKITHADEAQNAFRFGFASMDESELEQAVDLLKAELLGFGNFKM